MRNDSCVTQMVNDRAVAIRVDDYAFLVIHAGDLCVITQLQLNQEFELPCSLAMEVGVPDGGQRWCHKLELFFAASSADQSLVIKR